MSSIARSGPDSGSSAHLRARIAGFFYLLVFVTGMVALFTAGRLVLPGDAAATATNLRAHEALFRVGIASDLLMVACYVAVTALFYVLFKPVDKTLSLLAAFFSLTGCAVLGVAHVFETASLAVLGGEPFLSGFKPDQLQGMAFLFVKLFGQCYGLSLVFFGFYCILIGNLILRSGFMPRVLGVLMLVAGLGWVTFLWPPLSGALSPFILLPGGLGEGSLTLWLLVKGVDAQRWEERARRAGQ
jgi:uncharacterized protein DUF4386